MKIEIAKQLALVDEEDFRLCEEYSGRGMYGATTTGVVCPHCSIDELAVEYFRVTDSWEECGVDPDDHEDFDPDMPRWELDKWYERKYDPFQHGYPFRTDNMGLKAIIY
jgi:hypothetical protein